MGVGSHKRSQGEAAFTQTSHATPLPALFAPVSGIRRGQSERHRDRRLRRGEAERVEEKKIQERCARVRERRNAELQRNIEMIQRRTARHASAAGLVEERRLRAEFRQLCRW
ncbi:hypothetical protein BCY84_02799 [Trypanosoma cruzi cruzi]|nr:hypothetical protein BCY84_02799 [Trypanosoma cruzi cruzi]